MNDQQQRHVFISYVRENQEQVDQLCQELERHGAKVWLDRKSIKPGANWKDAIREAIRYGDFFIACFSKEYSSRQKSFMNDELTLAIDELRQFASDREWFIPVLLSECDVPARSIGGGKTLLDINWVPLYERWNAGIQRILSVIKPTPLEVQKLIGALLSKDSFVHERAADALANIGHDAIPALIEVVKDPDADVCRRALYSLGKIGPKAKSAVPVLIEVLKDGGKVVRKEAAYALGQMGPGAKAAVSNLIEILKNRSEERSVRQFAKEALGNIGSEAAPALIETLKSKDWDARNEAAYALGKIGSAAVPALVEALKDENKSIRKEAAYVLGKIGPSAAPALSEALKDKYRDVREAAAIALGNTGPANLPTLNKALKDKSKIVRRNATRALRIIGPEAKDAVISLVEALKDEDVEVRFLATVALGKDRPEAKVAVPALIEMLEDDNKDVRLSAAYSLATIGPEARAVPVLIEALKDQDIIYRSFVSDALKKINTPEAQKALEEYKQKSK